MRDCLDENVIAELSQGLLSEEGARRVDSHVERCDACRELLVNVSRSRASAQTVSPAVGDVVADKYRIEGVIGSGGMGVVVAARHLLLERKVALKLMHVDALASAEALERFMREGRAAVQLQSKHATRVMDLGTLPNGAPYIEMEHLEGEDLGRLIARKGPLEAGVAASYLIQACEAI